MVWGSEGNAWRVRNRVFDEESNSSTRTRFRSVIPGGGSNQGEILGSQTRLGGGKFLLGRLCLVCQWQPVWKDLKGLSEGPRTAMMRSE